MFTSREKQIHERLIRSCRQLSASMETIVGLLLDVAHLKLYRKLKRRNLVEYIIKDIGIDWTLTFDLNRVVAAALICPPLAHALRSSKISVGKATRILGALNSKNADELINFASTHTFAEINSFVGQSIPNAERRERCKQLSEDQFEVRLILSKQEMEDLKRAQSLEAQKQKSSKMSRSVAEALRVYLWHSDPVQKAKRAKARADAKANAKTGMSEGSDNAKTSAKSNARAGTHRYSHGEHTSYDALIRTNDQSIGLEMDRSNARKSNESVKSKSAFRPAPPEPVVRTSKSFNRRVRLTAAEHHAVILKTGGRCTFTDEHGKMCNSDRWLDVHHIVPVCEGGTNELSNLTQLCGSHHDIVHQLSLPIDGQVTWWRAGQTSERSSHA